MSDIHQKSINANPRWPQVYYEALAEAGVAQKLHSFYAQWVRQFFASEIWGRRRRDLRLADYPRLGTFSWRFIKTLELVSW